MKPTRTIKTADTLFDIIDKLHEQGAGRVTEIAKELELAKSTVYDHLATLEKRGYVVKQDGTYRLALRFLDHGTLVQRTLDVEQQVCRPLSQLAEDSGEAAWFIFKEQDRVFYLLCAFGDRAVNLHGRVGKQVSLHSHAGGKVILAQYGSTELEQFVQKCGLAKHTDSTITELEPLVAELNDVRSRGYAVDRGELVDGTATIAAPVLQEGTTVGSVCISGPVNRITDASIEPDTRKLVQETAEEISLRLTHEVPPD